MQKIIVFSAVIFSLMAGTLSYARVDDCERQEKQMDQLLFSGKFNRAEPVIRKCIEKHPKKIIYLSKLDIVLNGQGKYTEAEKHRKYILDTWHRYIKTDWQQKGSPLTDNSWKRMILPMQNNILIGTEFFEPFLINNNPRINAYYKLYALPRSQNKRTRIFMLELKQEGETNNYELREHYIPRFGVDSGLIIRYGNKRPAMHRTVKELAVFLAKGG